MNKGISQFSAVEDAKRFRTKVGVFLVLIRDGEVLLLRRHNTGTADGRYVTPMGGLELDESIAQAAIREAEEETGIHVRPSDLQVVHVMHRLHRMPSGETFPQVDVFLLSQSLYRKNPKSGTGKM